MSKVAVDPSQLLENLEMILDSDPHIDQVGFVHPAQFAAFDGEVSDEISKPNPGGVINFFWCREHKLGISTLVLLVLYNAAKDSFLTSYTKYRMSTKDEQDSAVETDVMKHSRALLLLSSDYGTAWNSRKMIVSKNSLFSVLMDELRLSTLVLSYSPKSERAWCHRKWVIKMMRDKCECGIREIVEKESELVKNIADKFKMNYRAWSYRCWLVSYMSNAHLLHELRSSRDWAAHHVADNSCYHYRSCLLLKILENMQHGSVAEDFPCKEFHQLWKDELDWVALLIARYVGREALWLHRRFLSLTWIKHLANGTCFSSSENSENISRFLKDELIFFRCCSNVPDNDFEDYQAQATHSATYIAWLAKQMPDSFSVELKKSSHYETLKKLFNDIGKSSLWDSFVASSRQTEKHSD